MLLWKNLLITSIDAPFFKKKNLGRYFSHIFEFTSEGRTFSPSCFYFLSPTWSLLPPRLVVSYCFSVLLFPFLWYLWHLTSFWVFLGPLAVVSEHSPPPLFSYCCFSPLFFTSFIFLSELYVSLSLSLHPYSDLILNITWAFTESTNQAQIFSRSIWRCHIGVCLFQGSLSLLGLWGFSVMRTSLVVSFRPSQHMHLHLLWAVFISGCRLY